MSTTSKPPRRRRWLTFSLRTFLIVSTLASLGIWGFVSWYWQPERNEVILPGGLVWREATKEAPPLNGQTNYVAHGPFTLFDRHGRTLATGRNAEGVPAGRWAHYHPIGGEALSGQCNEGLATGAWTAWDERGRRRLETTFESWDETLDTFPPPGSKTIVVSCRSGPFRQWWPNGRLRVEGTIQADAREGTWTYWDEGGRKTSEGKYHRGSRRGEWTMYDAPGDKPRLAWYVNGCEIRDPGELVLRLAKQLDSTDREAQFEAVEALGQLGGSAVPHLAKTLTAEDAPLSLWALRALVAIGAEAKPAIPAIEKLRASADRELRRETLVALFLLDEAKSASLFRELLQESDLTDIPDTRAWHRRLAEFGTTALPAIEQALNDSEAGMRLRALHVLSCMIAPNSLGWYEGNDTSARDAVWRVLEKTANDRDAGIGRAAKQILEWSKGVPWVFPGSMIPVVG